MLLHASRNILLEIDNLMFGTLPAQVRAWVTTRATRRVAPFIRKTYVSLEGGYPEVAKGTERVILLAELFAYDPKSPLDDTWFREYCTHLCAISDKHFRVECFELMVHALRKLKPRYSKGPLGAGNISGDFPDSLKRCQEAVRSLDRHVGVEPNESPKLVHDWLLHLQSDIDHYTEIAMSLDNGTDLLRKLSLGEMELIFCFLPDSYEEQNQRDTEYQRPLFASDSLMQEVLSRR